LETEKIWGIDESSIVEDRVSSLESNSERKCIDDSAVVEKLISITDDDSLSTVKKHGSDTIVNPITAEVKVSGLARYLETKTPKVLSVKNHPSLSADKIKNSELEKYLSYETIAKTPQRGLERDAKVEYNGPERSQNKGSRSNATKVLSSPVQFQESPFSLIDTKPKSKEEWNIDGEFANDDELDNYFDLTSITPPKTLGYTQLKTIQTKAPTPSNTTKNSLYFVSKTPLSRKSKTVVGKKMGRKSGVDLIDLATPDVKVKTPGNLKVKTPGSLKGKSIERILEAVKQGSVSSVRLDDIGLEKKTVASSLAGLNIALESRSLQGLLGKDVATRSSSVIEEKGKDLSAFIKSRISLTSVNEDLGSTKMKNIGTYVNSKVGAHSSANEGFGVSINSRDSISSINTELVPIKKCAESKLNIGNTKSPLIDIKETKSDTIWDNEESFQAKNESRELTGMVSLKESRILQPNYGNNQPRRQSEPKSKETLASIPKSRSISESKQKFGAAPDFKAPKRTSTSNLPEPKKQKQSPGILC
jgi:hypothetical protein